MELHHCHSFLPIFAIFSERPVFFFCLRSFLNRRSLRFSDCVTGQSPGIGRNEFAISIPVAPAVRGSWPSPSQGSLRRGWEAAGLGGWVWGLGQELAPEKIITFNIGKMGAVLVEEAGGKGLQGPCCIQRHKNQFFFRYIIVPTGENQAKKIAGKTSAATTWKATHHYGLHERKHLFLSFFCREIVCVRVLARRKKFAPS